jgi:hypothetical protein
MPSRNMEREQFWRLVLEEHAKSGLNARAFCRRESISEPSFYAWRRKLRERDAGPASVDLVPVDVVSSVSPVQPIDGSGGQIEVVMADGLVVRFRESCSGEAMARILSAARRVLKGSGPC